MVMVFASAIPTSAIQRAPTARPPRRRRPIEAGPEDSPRLLGSMPHRYCSARRFVYVLSIPVLHSASPILYAELRSIDPFPRILSNQPSLTTECCNWGRGSDDNYCTITPMSYRNSTVTWSSSQLTTPNAIYQHQHSDLATPDVSACSSCFALCDALCCMLGRSWASRGTTQGHHHGCSLALSLLWW